MASAEANGSELPQTVVCPHCKEELDLEDDGSFPAVCLGCGKDLPEKCPNCGKDRKTLRSGKLAAFCSCKYNFEAGTAPQTGTCVIWQHRIVLHK